MPTSTWDDIVARITGLLMHRFPRTAFRRIAERVTKEYDALADRPVQIYGHDLVEHAARSRLLREGASFASRPLGDTTLP